MRLLALVGAVLLAGAANAVAAEALVGDSGNTGIAAIVGAIVTTVGLTLAVTAWIDRRIDQKIRNYAAVEKFQYQTLLREISGLRELMGHAPLDLKLLAGID